MDPDRQLSLKIASELAGVPVKTLRRTIREGRLDAAVGADGAVTVKLSALASAGLLPRSVVEAEMPAAKPSPVVVEEAPVEPEGPRGRSAEVEIEAEVTAEVAVSPVVEPAPDVVEATYEPDPPPPQPLPPPSPAAERPLPARIDGGGGTWLSAGQAQELFRHLLSEREASINAWKERTEGLYREMIDEQRSRLARLEERNREATQQLQDALKRVPKLLEIEALEDANRTMKTDLDTSTVRAREAETERDRYKERVRQLETDLSRSERKSRELAENIRRLRRRRFWDRLVDREGNPTESA